MYILSKITKANKFCGKLHAANDEQTTLCGLIIDNNKWYILNTNQTEAQSTLKVTCPKCLQILKS